MGFIWYTGVKKKKVSMRCIERKAGELYVLAPVLKNTLMNPCRNDLYISSSQETGPC